MKKLSIGILTLLVSNSLFAANTGQNNVYIEQIGNSNTITIDQIGGTNNVGGVTTTTLTYGNDNVISAFTPAAASSLNYAFISGSSNTLALTHTGDSNWAQYSITGGSNRYTSTITGNSNKTRLSIGTSGQNGAKSDNIVTETIAGDLNYIIQSLTKGSINSSISLTGSSNQVTTRLNSTSGDVTTTVTGSNNSLINEQDDGGTGHQLTQAITGSYNSIVTQQQGSNDSVINISTNGDHNTITVHSTNSASIVDSKSAVVR